MSFFVKIILYPLIIIIQLYQLLISPWLGNNCRFTPTCSEYTKKALLKYGFYGIVLSIKRLIRCRPKGGSGYDPLP